MRWRRPQKPFIAFREAKRSAAMVPSPMTEALQVSKPKALSDDEEQIAELMVFGLPSDETIRGTHIVAGWPLTLEQAAIFVGVRTRFARNVLDNRPEFQAYRGKMLANRRKAELARNLSRAVEIRDNPGEGLAADRTVQLKAIGVIEGTEGKAGVVVNVNQQNNVATIQPGYVIRLPAIGAQPVAPAIAHDSNPAIIEHSVDANDMVVIEGQEVGAND